MLENELVRLRAHHHRPNLRQERVEGPVGHVVGIEAGVAPEVRQPGDIAVETGDVTVERGGRVVLGASHRRRIYSQVAAAGRGVLRLR